MERRINGHTGLLALFGTPVGHSGSPAMYNFSFQHDGLDYAYMAFDVNVEQMPAVFDSIRLFKMRGGNFTMPCKNIAAELVDKLSPAAEIIGACNVFVNDDGVITGHITDGVGFVKNLEVNGVDVKGKKTVLILNKIDLEQKLDEKYIKDFENIIRISAKEEIGLDELKQNIKDLFFSGSIETESLIISNSRHKQALIRALENAEEALVRVQRNEYLDLISIYVMSSLKALNEITGNELEEDLVNKIFGDFCVGK